MCIPAVCSVARLFPSFIPSWSATFPANIFSDESAPTAALQSGRLLRGAPQKTEGENDMEINHTFLLDQNCWAWACAARRVESITHYARLLTFLPTGSSANIGARIVIDRMSLLIEKCPHFHHTLIINSIAEPTATTAEKGYCRHLYLPGRRTRTYSLLLMAKPLTRVLLCRLMSGAVTFPLKIEIGSR